MKSRDRQAFRPALASSTGADYLEYRQLLSAVAARGHVDGVDQVRVSTRSAVASPGEDGSPGSQAMSATQAEDAANLAGARGESSGTRVQTSEAGATGPAESGSTEGSSDAGGSGEGTVAVRSSARAIAANADSGARQASVLDPTPWDEGGATRIAEAPALETSGGGGALVVSGVAPDSPVDDPVGSSAVAASPLGAAPPPLAAFPESPRSGQVNDAPSPIETGADDALVMNAGAGTSRTTVALDHAGTPRVLMSQGTVDVAPTDGDSDVIEAPTIQDPEPFPRCADLLTDCLPFDRASLENAIDRFLAPLEDLGADLVNWRTSTGLLPAATFIVTATLAAEVVRRRLRGRTATGNGGEELLAPFPDYPWAWSLGES